MCHLAVDIDEVAKAHGFELGQFSAELEKMDEYEEAGLLTRTMLVGQAVSESTGLYSLVIALLLLFVV